MAPPSEVRSVQRSLVILEMLNQHNGAGISDIMRHTGLPKSTCYRLLENLCTAGYLARAQDGSGYWLTAKVQKLSYGFEDERWIHEIVDPLLKELTNKFVYPTALATIYGTAMIIRANTDDISDLSLDRYPPGTPIPLFFSSSGWVHLAYCSKERREALLNICKQSDDPLHRIAHDEKLIASQIKHVRSQGYAIQRRQHTEEKGKTSTLSVPILSDRTLIGALVVRYIDSAHTPEDAMAKFYAPLKATARKIGKSVQSH